MKFRIIPHFAFPHLDVVVDQDGLLDAIIKAVDASPLGNAKVQLWDEKMDCPLPQCRCARDDGTTRFNINCTIHGKL